MELNVINTKIGQLRTAEGQVKSLIAELLPVVVDRIHAHNDVTSANAFLLALSPLNQKKVVAFLKEHAGHKIEEGILTKRLKSYTKGTEKVDPYKEASDKFDAFKQSGMNFWQWAVAKKAEVVEVISIEAVAKKAKKAREAVQEALEAGICDKVQAMSMLLGDVMTQDDILNVLAAMTQTTKAVDKAAAESLPTPA